MTANPMQEIKPEVPRDSKGEIMLNEVFDGKVWAEEFKRIVLDGKIEIDEGLMFAWFCNSIMAGYDYAYREVNSKPSPVPLSEEKQ